MANLTSPQCTCEPTADEDIMKLDPECSKHGYKVPYNDEVGKHTGDNGLVLHMKGNGGKTITFNPPSKDTQMVNAIAHTMERAKQAQFKQWYHEHLTHTNEYSDIFDMLEEITQAAWKAGYEQCMNDTSKK